MRRRRFVAAACLGVMLAGCDRVDRYTDAPPGVQDLTVYSTTDTQVFAPVVADFKTLYPNVRIRYVELEAAPLHRRFLEESRSGRAQADLLLSSAMDLQVQLVNDGHAAPHHSDNSLDIPRWANWRDEAFGITFEPVVMVYNKRAMAGRAIPQSRPELLEALRTQGRFWRGRIGTYDVVESSVGYLIASQDARNSGDFGALVEAFRDAHAIKRGTTSDLLDLVESGEIAVGYNLLGSYARARAESAPDLQLVYPKDYTLAVSRTAVIPRDAPHIHTAHLFLEYLLSLRGQRVLTNQSRLSAVRSEVEGRFGKSDAYDPSADHLRPIPLGPGLLVYLDRLKRARFLGLWGQPQRPMPQPVASATPAPPKT